MLLVCTEIHQLAFLLLGFPFVKSSYSYSYRQEPSGLDEGSQDGASVFRVQRVLRGARSESFVADSHGTPFIIMVLSV